MFYKVTSQHLSHMDNSAQTTIYSQVCHLLISELQHLYKMVLDITFSDIC